MTAFIRPKFTLPVGTDPFPNKDDPRTIYDVLYQSATTNPDHVYALQLDRSLDPSRAIRLTHRDLHKAVDRCSAWLVGQRLAVRSTAHTSETASGPKTARGKAVAIFLSSDLSILIYVIALLKLGNPVALFSARLSGAALDHLVQATNTAHILTTPAQWRSVQDEVPHLTEKTVTALPLTDFLVAGACPLDSLPMPQKGEEPDSNDMTVFAWHSSGSTGLPKPVFHTHRFWHCYLGCHQFDLSDRVEEKIAVNMPPLYHGFGMLPMSLAISVGFTVILPPPSTIPTAQLIVEIMHSTKPHILFTVPSLLTDMLQTGSASTPPPLQERASPVRATTSNFTDEALSALRTLDLVAFGGAPIKASTGETMAAAGVKLLNHFGATETGSLAAIRMPPPGYEWRWLTLREDMGIEYRPMPGVDPTLGYLQLSSRPFGWAERFFVADALVQRQVEEIDAVGNVRTQTFHRIAGRVDNVIVLATGEKVSPMLIEEALSNQPEIDEVIVFGSGRFQIGALLEISFSKLQTLDDASDGNDPSLDAYKWPTLREQILDSFWPAVEKANAEADTHAKLDRSMILLTTRSLKPFARTAKGTAARQATLDSFEPEIERAYAELELIAANAASVPLDLAAPSDEVEELLKHMVRTSLTPQGSLETSTIPIGSDDDFFEAIGLDSLKAKRLHRALTASLRKTCGPSTTLPPNIVYQHCTIRRLVHALQAHLNVTGTGQRDALDYGLGQDQDSVKERTAAVWSLLDSVQKEMSNWADEGSVTLSEQEAARSEGSTVLVTGSTGSLGAWLVYALLKQGHRVICVVRASAPSHSNPNPTSPLQRQLDSLSSKGVPQLSSEQLAKLSAVGTSDLSAPRFGLAPDDFHRVQAVVTHVIHNAWPVDFLRPLHSFANQVRATARLLHLARAVAQARRPLRFVFSSTIATVGRSYLSTPTTPVPETELADASLCVPSGYGLAKLACELLISRVCGDSGGAIDGTSIRIGQLTGAERVGNWSTSEHMALILASSAKLKCLPQLAGTLSWIPSNRAADAYVDILMNPVDRLPPILHLENLSRTPWQMILDIIAKELAGVDAPSNVSLMPSAPLNLRRNSDVLMEEGDVDDTAANRKRQRTADGNMNIAEVSPTLSTASSRYDDSGSALITPSQSMVSSVTTLSQSHSSADADVKLPIVPYAAWLEAIKTSPVPDLQLPARKLIDFLEGDFVPISTGGVVLDMQRAKGLSPVLSGSQGVTEEHVREYLAYWREQGLL
ncbi:hypothetical protein OC845_001543 [Tilletia horrida]|nr:hypothetical protein OC845_001543 [Tilletia horrida]